MNTKSLKLILISICILCLNYEGNNLFAQRGIVGISDLRIQRFPYDSTYIIGKLNKGDTIKLIRSSSTWVLINFKGNEGYVNKENLYNNFNRIIENLSDATSPKTNLDSIPLNRPNLSTINDSLAKLDSLIKSETRNNMALKINLDSSAKRAVQMTNQSKGESVESVKNSEVINAPDKSPKGFKIGFSETFQSYLGYVFCIAGIISLISIKRDKDGRYSDGYKPLKISFFGFLTFAFWVLIISSFIGLIGGIISWIHTF